MPDITPIGPFPQLQAQDISVCRMDGEREALRLEGLSLTLRSGECTLLTGASGSGKSSLLLALARLIPLAAGRLTLNGSPAEAVSPLVWRTRVNLVLPQPVMLEGSVRDNLLLPWQFRAQRGVPSPTGDDLREGLLGLGLGQIELAGEAGRLSSGQMARVALLRGLLLRPEIMLLDEPTAHLDPVAADQFWSVLRAYQQQSRGAVLCCSHRPPGAWQGPVLRLEHGTLRQEPA